MKMVFKYGAGAAVLAVAGALAGCGGHGTTATGDSSGDQFVAYTGNFASFLTWNHYQDTLVDGSGNLPTGVAGSRDQYLNTLPPHGSTEFPVGTIIVEVREDGKIFAAAKRGGDFNADGCVNWEFFELAENPVAITWRGLGPPAGDTYGGDPNGCNDCHSQCKSNDYVCSPKLQLSSF